MTTQTWRLEWKGATLYHLHNRTGQDCVDIAVATSGLQLDGQGPDYIRIVESVGKDDVPIALDIAPAFGHSCGEVLIAWGYTDSGARYAAVHLAP